MSKALTLDVLTPERQVCCIEADMVIARAVDGEVGILRNHAPLVVALDIAPLRFRVDESEEQLAVSGGFMEVRDNRVTIVSPCAETAEEIDVKRAEAARERAEERISRPTPEIDVHRAELALRRAIVRLKIAEHTRR